MWEKMIQSVCDKAQVFLFFQSRSQIDGKWIHIGILRSGAHARSLIRSLPSGEIPEKRK